MIRSMTSTTAVWLLEIESLIAIGIIAVAVVLCWYFRKQSLLLRRKEDSLEGESDRVVQSVRDRLDAANKDVEEKTKLLQDLLRQNGILTEENQSLQEKLDGHPLELKKAREQSVKISRSVNQGRAIENLAPYLKDVFPWHPDDAYHFGGGLFDYIIADGLRSEGELRKVVFVEIKTGKTKSLTKNERQIKKVIGEKKVSWEMVHIGNLYMS